MLEQHIFVFDCHGANHPIAIPQDCPLGRYGIREYKRDPEAWNHLNFACLGCGVYFTCSEEDRIRAVDEPGEYKRLAEFLSSQYLWRLCSEESPPWYVDGPIYTIAAKTKSEDELIQEVRALVERPIADPKMDQPSRRPSDMIADYFNDIKLERYEFRF